MKKVSLLLCMFFVLVFSTPVFAAGTYTITAVQPREDGFIRVILDKSGTSYHRFIADDDTNKNQYLATILTAMNNGWTVNVTTQVQSGKSIITSIYVYTD